MNIATIHLDKICRSCLSEEDQLTSIFNTMNTNDVRVIEMFQSCAFLEPEENDGLPNKICLKCFASINEAYIFKKQCQKSDEMLRTFLRKHMESVKIVKIETIIYNNKNDTNNEEEEYTEDTPEFEDNEVLEQDMQIDEEQEMHVDSTINEVRTDSNISEIIYECSQCDEYFTNAESFHNHNFIHHNETEQAVFCAKCGKKCKSEQILAVHLKVCGMHECKICHKIFKTLEFLQSHIKKHENYPDRDKIKYESEEYSGNVDSVSDENDVDDNQTVETSEKSLICQKCGKKCRNEQVYAVHFWNCSMHECKICSKKFKSIGFLQHHMKKHDPNYTPDPDDKRYKCSECGKSYTSPANLQIHQYSHSGIKPYKCDFCEKGFTKMTSLNTHLAVHTGIKTHLCPECGKAFTSASILNQHKKIHSGVRPFKCSQCPREFVASGDLTVHMRVHTGEKPYLCPTCGRGFARITHLNTHIRTHTGERPFVCNECGRGFAQSGDLRSHERTHTGERPYVCTICNRSFSQSSGLASHMTTHTKIKSHKCNVCNKAFSQSSSLLRHGKTHLSDNLNEQFLTIDTV